MNPLSMWMAITRSTPNARFMSAAHTVESTPPDNNICDGKG
jgi:hypothetical protein